MFISVVNGLSACNIYELLTESDAGIIDVEES